MKGKSFKLIVSILLPMLVGGVAGIFTVEGTNGWYRTLNAPSFNPPDWIFGPVWTMLYLLMGISLYLIWIEVDSALKSKAIRIFFLQLALNFVWSFLFFYFNNIDLALAEIVLLWITIVWMIIQFMQINKTAAFLNIPYLFWVSFATALNIAFATLN